MRAWVVVAVMCSLAAMKAVAVDGLSVDEVPQLSLKETRAALKARGVSCPECFEKKEFQERLIQTLRDEASKPPTTDAAASPEAEGGANPKVETIDEDGIMSEDMLEGLRSSLRKKKAEKDDLMAKLRKAGINAHMFDKDDMGGLEGLLNGVKAKKKGGRSSPPGNKGQQSKKEVPNPKRNPIADDDDAISDEL